MVEVPEHLLRRTRERKEALGLVKPGESAAGSAEATGGETTSSSVPAPAGGAAPAAPSTPSAPPAPPSYTGPPQPPPPRNRIPVWVMPVLAAIPLWAFFFVGALGDRPVVGEVDPLERGAEVYVSAGCAGCHGSAGEGNESIEAPALADKEVEKTFPNEEDHLAWVRGGSIGDDQPYGDPDREGGQRKSQGGMPAFGGTLSDEDIEAVVMYEREGL